MKTWILSALLLSVALMGCGRAPKQAASVNSETFTLNEADTLLAQPLDPANQQAEAMPLTANIVVNKDVPLSEPVPVSVTRVTDTPDNKMIQQALKNLGLYAGDIDGKIGPKTKGAIEEFQTKNNLTADGKVGRKTWAVLKNALESPTQVPSDSAITN